MRVTILINQLPIIQYYRRREQDGKQVFEDFFARVLSLCIETGLVKGEKVFVDGRLIQAHASMKSLTHREDALAVLVSPREYVERVFEENPIEEEDFNNAGSGEEGGILIGTEGNSLFQCDEQQALPRRDPPRVFRSFYSLIGRSTKVIWIT